ncbi:hypothetical protein V2J09_020209 [Rumex salicifolius]
MRTLAASPSTCLANPLKKPSNFSVCSSVNQWRPSRIGSRLSSKLMEERLSRQDCRLQASKYYMETLRSSHSVDIDNISHLPLLKKNSKDDTDMDAHILPFNMSLSDIMKFSLLFGTFSLQAAQPALAAADFAGNLQLADFFGDLSDISTGFASAFLLIFFSELGDKTFFIAAILAARNSGAVIFTGTFGALTLGQNDLPIDDIAAVCLLVYFGVSTLIAASNDDLQGDDEQKEAELAVSKFTGNGAGILSATGTVISTFALVFVAEWGDKSFFSTVALAAASSPLGVIGGSLAGHGVATLIAVLGGSLLGTFLSEKVIAYTGGVLFLVFAGITLIEIIKG